MLMATADFHFLNSQSLKGREDRYRIVHVQTAKILKSWQKSLFSFEWLDEKGAIRSLDNLPLHERDKRLKVEKSLQTGQVVERPVLGIGLMDNVEIGAGRDVFLTLAAKGEQTIEVHIPVSCAGEFKEYIIS